MSAIYVFYGFSGSLRNPTPAFPDGTDYDTSFKLVADTLGVSLRKLFPTDTVTVLQAWTKDKILAALETSSDPVKQVHIAAHGDSTSVSLAYHFDHWNRLLTRARLINASIASTTDKALRTLRDEDALIAGVFERGLSTTRRNAIKANMAPDASWQIWGCWAGDATTTHGAGTTHPDLMPYFQRLNFGLPSVPGIAVDIAKSLGVKCTAARGGAGLEFWHGKRAGRQVLINDNKTQARPPFWLWRGVRTDLVTYDATGAELPDVHIFGQKRAPADLPYGKPPKWLTDLAW